MHYTAILIPLMVLIASCQNSKPALTYNLHENWMFREISDTVWMPASVPGAVHTDLMDNGKIEDPYHRLNELDVQWVDKKDWEYQSSFTMDHKILAKDRVELVFEGLDTYAKVYLNNVEILNADNMFLEYTVECKALLRPGQNQIKILFESPIIKGLAKKEELGYYLPGAENDQSERGGVGNNKTCVFTRKAQYHFGWDWGPRLVSMGIWKDLKINAWDDANISDVNIKQKKLDDPIAELEAHVEIESQGSGKYSLIWDTGTRVIKQEITLDEGRNEILLPATIERPIRWWPNGYGDQHLYDFEFRLLKNSKLVDTHSMHFGLRTIEVVQEPDSIGKSFLFQINGIPIFMKGANYIPQDIFLHRVKVQDYERLIKSAVDANFNMIRVWGGGIYEKDIFYDLCDQYGILVWQDFMFACAMYPGNEAFLENVRMEAVQNVKRLRNHASLAIWCGDNEILSAWNRWGWKENVLKEQGDEVMDIVWNAYDTLFHHILPSVVSDYDPQRLYWTSSPSAGFGELENWKSGDVHYWGVWWGKEPFSNYGTKIGRFMSEYGFQSFPDFNSVKKYTIEADWDIYSEVMQSHQRSSIGNVTIDEYLNRDYRKPKDFPMFLYVNHVLQAEGIRTAIEAHRRNRPFCMGSLYWQMNDTWPVASWSGIDYYGSWKALHYFAKKAYAPLLVSPVSKDNGEFEIFIVSDEIKDRKAILQLKILDFSGIEKVNIQREIEIKGNEASLVFSAVQEQLIDNMDPEKTFMLAQIKDDSGAVLAENTFYFLPVKQLDLQDPGLEIKLDQVGETVRINLSTQKLAKNVYLFANGLEGIFSNNYFDLLPGQKTVISFYPDQKLNLQTFKDQLKVYSLRDSYE